MPTINGGSDKMLTSIFGRQRDAVEYIAGVLSLSGAGRNGDQYGPRIIVLVERIQVGRMLSDCARNLCSCLVI